MEFVVTRNEVDTAIDSLARECSIFKYQSRLWNSRNWSSLAIIIATLLRFFTGLRILYNQNLYENTVQNIYFFLFSNFFTDCVTLLILPQQAEMHFTI